MTRIVGLDLSLTSTGIAVPDGTTYTIRPERSGTTPRRLNELFGKLWRHVDAERPHLALIEGPSLHSPGPLGQYRRHQWVGCAILALERIRCEIVEVPPSTLKSWATGNGNAPKDRMLEAARDAGGDPANDDEADAYLLWALGRLTVDDVDVFDDPKSRIRRLAIADQLAWPDLRELVGA